MNAATLSLTLAAMLLGSAPDKATPSASATAAAPAASATRSIPLAKVRWGMDRAALRRTLGIGGDVPFAEYSHFPASWQQFRAPAQLGPLRGFLHFWLAEPGGLQCLNFRPAGLEHSDCLQDLTSVRRALEKDFGPAHAWSGPAHQCLEWSPGGTGALRACCAPLIPEERPSTRLARLDIYFFGPEQPGVDFLTRPRP